TQATQEKTGVPPEASGGLPASSINEAALTLPPRPASPVGQKETSPPPQPQRSESADSAVPTIGPVAGIILPTDQGLYITLPPDAKKKSYLIATGSCRPTGPFPRDKRQGNRCFSDTYYTTTTKTRLHKVHLFTVMRGSKEYETGNIYLRGLTHMQNLRFIPECVSYMNSERETGELTQTSRETREMPPITGDRGHREIIGQSNSGNFLSIIQLLACYDPVLKELLERPQGSVKYLSPAIQNEIVYIIAQRVQCDIQEEINSAPFFSVIMDTTHDISKRDQLSRVYRYVTIQRDENNNAKDILINEAFLGFEETVDTSARELQKKIVDSIRSNRFYLSKCWGQGYDGVANMSGVYSGVQARIMEMELLAKYVHCAAHSCRDTSML
ncbi:hypothetical protein F7725_021412, partial [Scomber scombrus]